MFERETGSNLPKVLRDSVNMHVPFESDRRQQGSKVFKKPQKVANGFYMLTFAYSCTHWRVREMQPVEITYLVSQSSRDKD